MLRVAVITRYFPSSGEPEQGRSLYETLRILGRSIEVRVFYPNATYPAILKPRSRLYNKLDTAFCLPDVKVKYCDFPALPLVSRPLNGWMAARTLLPHVRTFAPDLVFGCYLYPEGFTALRIGRSLGVPVAVMSIGSDINRIGGSISARLTRTVLRTTDSLVTVSEDLRQKAVAMGAPPARTRAILNGCDLSVFHPGDRCQARRQLKIDRSFEVMVYVGRIDLKKGLRELVEAAAMLHPGRPCLHCYLVGNGPDKARIEDTIRTHGAGSYVHLASRCAFDEVAIWMSAADLVALPSYMEGCPNVILEALASGRPVVASNVGGIPEIMNNNCGRLVPPRDPASLAEALACVLNTSWDPAVISSHCGRSWSAPAEELLQTMERLVSPSRSVSTCENRNPQC